MLVTLDINSVLNNQVVGFVCTGVAAVFFGSNYVVSKKVPVGDGIAFQWFMSLGILLVGYACLLISGNPIWVLEGLIGGALWAAGNAVVPLCIQWAGLALPFLLWSISNLVTGWFIGKFGLLGVEQEDVPIPWLNDIGPALGIIALIFYVLIKPTVKDENLKMEEDDEGDTFVTKQAINEAAFPEEDTDSDMFSFLGARTKQVIACVMSLIVGMMYGVSMAPYQIWYDQQDPANSNPFMFVISQYSGVFLMSSAVFLCYAVFKRNRPQVYSVSVLPAMISGAMWGIAEAAWMISNGTLGMVIAYPIVAVCPMLINTLWAVFLFHEIQGKRNIILLAIAMSFTIMSVACTALSSL